MDFLQPFLDYAINQSRKPKPKVQEFVYRDEPRKKTITAPVKAKKKVHFESEPLIQSHESCCKQVKILMTKAEAARLLSKCKYGGILELRDVADVLSISRKDD